MDAFHGAASGGRMSNRSQPPGPPSLFVCRVCSGAAGAEGLHRLVLELVALLDHLLHRVRRRPRLAAELVGQRPVPVVRVAQRPTHRHRDEPAHRHHPPATTGPPRPREPLRARAEPRSGRCPGRTGENPPPPADPGTTRTRAGRDAQPAVWTSSTASSMHGQPRPAVIGTVARRGNRWVRCSGAGPGERVYRCRKRRSGITCAPRAPAGAGPNRCSGGPWRSSRPGRCHWHR